MTGTRRAKLTRMGRVVVDEGRHLLDAAEQRERKAQRAKSRVVRDLRIRHPECRFPGDQP
uniref:hypothetical protein n=1 Tax=Burkholderia semiarida TaxID=2843303 RepID=UPI003F524B30